MEGDVPSPTKPPSGCCFHTRCPVAMKVCSERVPEWREIEPGHELACHLFDKNLSEADRQARQTAERFRNNQKETSAAFA